MTACKDSLNGKKAVSATLAGVLAVGMVPAAAFAADDAQADAASDEGIELQTAGDVTAFNNGSITAAELGGEAVDDVNDITTAATGEAQKLVPTEITTASGIEIDLTEAATAKKFKVTYQTADEEGNPTGTVVSAPTDPGKYAVVVEGISGDYKGGKVSLSYDIMPASLGTVGYFEVDPDDADNYNDSVLTYTGNALEIGFTSTVKGADQQNVTTILKEGKDYTVKFVKAGSSIDADGVDVVDAAPYVAVINGLGKYASGTAVQVPVTVNAFDLSKATIAVDDVVASNKVPTAPTSVKIVDADNPEKNATLADPSLVKLTFESGPTLDDGTVVKTFSTAGEYTFSAAKADSKNTNLTASGDIDDVTVNKVQKAATFKYDGEAVPSTFSTDLSKTGYKVFDASKIKGYNGKTELNGDFTVSDKDGNDVTSDFEDGKIDQAGTYTVKYTVDPADNGYVAGGSVETVVTVIAGSVDADATAYVAYDGKTITSLEAAYDGTGITADTNTFVVTVTTKDEDGNVETLDEGDDYEVLFKNADGEEVDTFKDAGTYTVEIVSDTYAITGESTVTVTIDPADLATVKLPLSDKGEFVAAGTDADDFAAALKYNTGEKDDNGKDVWAEISDSFSDDVDVTVEKLNDEGEWAEAGDEFDEGSYRVTVAAKDDEKAANFDFAGDGETVVEFEVIDEAKVIYKDVKSTDWWFEAVAAVHSGTYTNVAGESKKFAGYMNGIGADLFTPAANTSRAMMAQVLYNIANGGGYTDDTVIVPSDEPGFKSFDDVATNMWYAEAVAWAKQAGIVTGYGDTGLFGPEDNVTREQFATMLFRFAKAYGVDTSVDVEAALATMPDGDQVSEFAKEGVAWCVQNKLMGNGGAINPTAEIIRAEAAQMALNYAKFQELPYNGADYEE